MALDKSRFLMKSQSLNCLWVGGLLFLALRSGGGLPLIWGVVALLYFCRSGSNASKLVLGHLRRQKPTITILPHPLPLSTASTSISSNVDGYLEEPADRTLEPVLS